MKERTILADCCEDWILQFGEYYRQEEDFACPECATGWQKLGTGRFQRAADRRVFVKRSRAGESTHFSYLSAEDGTEPLLERCCAQILLRHGERLAVEEFRCPVCHTHWAKKPAMKGGVEVTCFQREGLEEPFAIQVGAPRRFLVPLRHYRQPSE